jgi:hypothetical protein
VEGLDRRLVGKGMGKLHSVVEKACARGLPVRIGKPPLP